MKNLLLIAGVFFMCTNSFAQFKISPDGEIAPLNDLEYAITIKETSKNIEEKRISFGMLIKHFSYVNHQLSILSDVEKSHFLSCMELPDYTSGKEIKILSCSRFVLPVAPHSKLIEAAKYFAEYLNSANSCRASLTEQSGVYSFTYIFQNKNYPLF